MKILIMLTAATIAFSILKISFIKDKIKDSFSEYAAQRVLKCFHQHSERPLFVDRIDFGCGPEYSPENIKARELLNYCGISEIEFETYGTLNTKSAVIAPTSVKSIEFPRGSSQTYRIGKMKWTFLGFSYEEKFNKITHKAATD